MPKHFSMKKLFTLLCFFIHVIILQAQNYDFQWASNQFENVLPNGTLLDTITSPLKATTETSGGLAEDHNGNIITVSHFIGNYLTFPPLNKFYISVGGTIALQKRNTNGDILWTNWIDGGDYSIVGAKRIVKDVAVDSQNNIYICGYINDTTDFDTDTAQAIGVSPTTFTGYVAKYNTDGDFQWLYQLSGANDCDPYHIEVDPNDDVIVFGLFRGKLDFDASSGTALDSSLSNKDDLFLLKLDSLGGYVWHNRWGSIRPDDPTGLALDSNGNIYISALFSGSLDTDPGPNTNSIATGGGGLTVNAYVGKFANDGSWLWTSEFDCSGSSWIYDIASDGQSICTVGDFSGTLNVGHSGTTTTVPQASPGNDNITMIKLDTAGQYEWDYQPEELSGGMTSFGYEIGHHNRNWLAAFSSYDDMDLDNGPGVDSIGTTHRTEYLVQVDSNGNYLEYMRYNMDAFGFVELHQLAGNGRDLYIVGHYEDATLDVNPDPNKNEILPLNYLYTFFVTKLSSSCQNTTFDTIAPMVCTSYTSPSGDTIWNSSGTYIDTISNAEGCDSIITVNLTILSPSFGIDSITACDSLTWINGVTYTSSNNTATDTLTNAFGCDSVVALNLTINTTVRDTNQVIACNSHTWSRNGQTYTSSGFYSDTLTAANGCDSISTIDLTIRPSTATTIVQTACDQYTWLQNGITYTTTGMYKDTILNSAGCDSVLTLDLTINSTVKDTNQVTACNSYTWFSNGQTYTSSGFYSDTLTAANGCDSIVTLNLTIDTVNLGITQNGFTLIANQAGASYQWLDCSNGNIPVAGATSQSFDATANGDYAVEVILNSCTDTSSCITVFDIGLTNLSGLEETISIYPNPTRNSFVIELRGVAPNEHVQIYSLDGKLIKEQLIQSKRETIDVANLADGAYVVKYGHTIQKLAVIR